MILLINGTRRVNGSGTVAQLLTGQRAIQITSSQVQGPDTSSYQIIPKTVYFIESSLIIPNNSTTEQTLSKH
jgi:hypothetical protein